MERPGRRALGAGLASVEMILILTTAKCWLRIMKDFDIKEQIILHRMWQRNLNELQLSTNWKWKSGYEEKGSLIPFFYNLHFTYFILGCIVIEMQLKFKLNQIVAEVKQTQQNVFSI